MVVSCRIASRFSETNGNLDIYLSADILKRVLYLVDHTHISEKVSGIFSTISASNLSSISSKVVSSSSFV